jgi:copper homeostasis protein
MDFNFHFISGAMTKIQICVYSLASAVTAQEAGAHNIELCGGRAEGGITPSAGLIKLVRAAISIPIFVMIRPRGGDFMYTDSEVKVMCADIDHVKELGVDGVVLGVLKADGSIDEERSSYLVKRAKPLQVTFHRAFDMTRDPMDALEAIIRTGTTAILTSGQKKTALEGADLLKSLVQQASGRIEILAGSGVSEHNASILINTGVQWLHLSGGLMKDGGMEYRKGDVSMQSTVPGEYERVEADGGRIKAVIEMCRTDIS